MSAGGAATTAGETGETGAAGAGETVQGTTAGEAAEEVKTTRPPPEATYKVTSIVVSVLLFVDFS